MRVYELRAACVHKGMMQIRLGDLERPPSWAYMKGRYDVGISVYAKQHSHSHDQHAFIWGR